MPAIDSSETLTMTRIGTISTTVEEAHALLEAYVDMIRPEIDFSLDDAEEAGVAVTRIYALLAAIKPQLDRLKHIPEALMALGRDIKQPQA